VTGTERWVLRDTERLIQGNKALLGEKHDLVAVTRIRNEALILPDTLDYLSKHVDAIIAYDDASTDETVEMLREHPNVVLIIENTAWEQDMTARRLAEGRHRGLLLQTAREAMAFDWMLCFDPDERVTGDIKLSLSEMPQEVDGVRVQLFDAYMTKDDHAPFGAGSQLLDFRRYFGPERREILMFWRNKPKIHFAEHHAREPGGLEVIATDLYCQHYGKSLSLDHWEETCDYYIKHFPYETYGKKWTERKGKGIHTESDFQRPLYEWGDELFANAVKIER
jgi:glycosyltransferase involved in cell wall biosynthesis